MKITIQPSQYSGSILAPASKSYMQRALAIALLSKGETILKNPSFCNDALSAIEMSKNLGAQIESNDEGLRIIGANGIKKQELNAGEAGLGIRMFVSIAALFGDQVIFKGMGSLNNRPLHMPEEEMAKLGVKMQSKEGFLPLQVQGPLKSGKIRIDGAQSSQFLTGLLIALPLVEGDSEIEVVNLKSKPYIDMTMEVMEYFGVKIRHESYKHFFIPGNQEYQSLSYQVEGDWSGVAFHLVGGAIHGEVEVRGIHTNSKQADRKILEVLDQVGAIMEIKTDAVKVSKGRLTPFTFDATNCPDLFPPLSNLAAVCQGRSIIKGVSRLKHKESNRAMVIQDEWRKLGIHVDLIDDEMHIFGGKSVSGKMHSNNDHRIAMMGAIASLNAYGPIEIEEAEAVNKSYPDFFEDFQKLTEE